MSWHILPLAMCWHLSSREWGEGGGRRCVVCEVQFIHRLADELEKVPVYSA